MSAFSTNDLRSGAKPYQRDKNHTSKWARGPSETAITLCTQHEQADPKCVRCTGPPAKRDYDRRIRRSEAKYRHLQQNKLTGQASTLARKAFRNEVVDAMDGPLANVSDTSSDGEEVPDSSAAPLPAEADFMYNYDALTGPRAGNDILSNAITQAVRRFENNETEKLVIKEYDVVSDKDAAAGYAGDYDDEHDFEIIEHSHLK
ncbi:uncharacterized protein A1O9_04014 [Exophiala aquamarina CBS 119918]|uniref:Uncharacterized protein n=1 Tax=Exophiala aquamarina CBS 119918 TaxID=1182545 RepID=A0A072PUG4_9EURO|nr:uncharacterized protein A1O9_04014 [Exophiala aquamarina CBS 119918]KEF59170.1 hypothetical protein A1O9_04014 [Exophiala aquamarina CBS 119918]